jgi:pimeloyl-ACP methyl ester carboxylesterase
MPPLSSNVPAHERINHERPMKSLPARVAFLFLFSLALGIGSAAPAGFGAAEASAAGERGAPPSAGLVRLAAGPEQDDMRRQDADSYTRGWSPDGKIRFITLPDGTRLRYLKTGAGPALLLLHPLRAQLDYFQRLVPRLAARFTVYAVDLPGLGWSDIRADASYEEAALRRVVVAFAKALNLADLTIVGESMGATLALTASTEMRDRVRHVVALNTYDYAPGIERANFLASVIVKAMRVPGVGSLFAGFENESILSGIMEGGFFDPAKLPADFVQEQLKSGRRPGYAAVATGYFGALESYVAARSLYGRVKVPVTLVYGDHDWSTPEERREVAQLVPGSRLITLERSGHFGALEQPDEIARIIIGRARGADGCASPSSAQALQRACR